MTFAGGHIGRCDQSLVKMSNLTQVGDKKMIGIESYFGTVLLAVLYSLEHGI